MKIQIIEDHLEVPQIIIKCHKVDQRIERLKSYIEKFDVKLKAKDNKEVCYVEMKDVLYFESVENRTFLYMEDTVLEVEQRLYELENSLSGTDFIRSSKSQIINIAKIKSLRPQINRTIIATMCNEEKLIISRKYVPVLKKILSI